MLQINIFDEINLLLTIIYSFTKFKVLLSIPKSLTGPDDHKKVMQMARWACN